MLEFIMCGFIDYKSINLYTMQQCFKFAILLFKNVVFTLIFGKKIIEAINFVFLNNFEQIMCVFIK